MGVELCEQSASFQFDFAGKVQVFDLNLWIQLATFSQVSVLVFLLLLIKLL